MAISKIKPIRSTLDKAIEYITDSKKTENGILIGSFGCSPQTASIEMSITANKGRGNGNRQAYHMIQSFDQNDDLTPEKALEIGKQFADKVCRGKHEYVIATHIDKGHIHNHIIFNSTSFVDYKKYHYSVKERHNVRRINDQLCRENNLAVIEKFAGKRGHGIYENEKRKTKSAWKLQLEEMIDKTILESKSFEEFVEHMELEGYSVKRGERISFGIPGRERNCRGDRLGEAYTEVAIRARIEGVEWQKDVPKTENKNREKTQKSSKVQSRNNGRINLIVDISKNIKAQESKGYEKALIKGNINTLVKTMNYLIEHNLKTPEDFMKHYSVAETEFDFTKKNRKKLSEEMLDLREKIKFTQNYKKYKSIYLQSSLQNNDPEFYHKNENEIIQYKSALIYFEKNGINPDIQNLSKMFDEYRSLKEEKIQNDLHYKNAKERKMELDILKKNIEYALDMEDQKEQKMSHAKEERNDRPDINSMR